MTDGSGYTVETENNGWSYIIGPNGYREGPIRYRWEAEEWAESLNDEQRRLAFPDFYRPDKD